MLAHAEFWVAVAFVIFMVIVWRAGAFSKMASGLDTRTQRIETELSEAKRLREEAAAVLAEYTRKREQAEKEALEIVSNAKDEAERVAEEAHRKLSEFIARRTASAEAKIAQAEAQATAEVRTAAAEAAVRAAELVLRETVSGPAGADLLARSVAEVKTKLN